MTILFRGAEILATSPSGVNSHRADVLIEGSSIVAVGRDLPVSSDARIIEAAGHLLMPGLVNGHFHSPVNHMKGALDSLPLEIFMLYESPSLDVLRPDPREAYVRTMLAAIDMLHGGVTAVQDDAFFVPYPTPDIIDAVMQAYADSGIRARVALDQPNVPELIKLPYLKDLLPTDLAARLAETPAMDMSELLALYDHLITRWHGTEHGRLKAAVSISAPQRVTVPYFEALDDLSRRHDLPFYAHMLETKVQRVLGNERFAGRSLVRYTADLGLLSDRMNLIHGIWVDAADLDLIAEAGTVVAHNPISNLRLGSGVMPWRAMRERGIPICLGTDEAIADDAVNMWGVAKAAGLVHNITDPDWNQWPKAHEILHAVINGGARAMREESRLGAIEPGHEADLILVDLDTMPFTPLNDLARQLIYCENGTSVRMTMVAGRVVYDGSSVTGLDEKALRAEAREIFGRRRAVLAEAARDADLWLPSYRAMVLKAAATDVGMNRWVAGPMPG